MEWMQVDLASLQSIANFAQEFISRDIPLHVLVCNAGVLSSTFKYVHACVCACVMCMCVCVCVYA